MKNAFVMRIKTLGATVQDALEDNELILGWSYAHGLIGAESDQETVKRHLAERDTRLQTSKRALGSASGNVHRFLNEMAAGDLVVVPDGPAFLVGRVASDPFDRPEAEAIDGRIRRKIEWLTKEAIPRSHARSRLVSRMRSRQTVTRAGDLIDEIEYALKAHGEGREPTFTGELRVRLVEQTLSELRDGRMDEREFERLLADLLVALGASEVEIVERRSDVGVDVKGKFLIAGQFETAVGIQAKYFRPYPPVGSDVVEQLASGMQEEGIDLGIVATSGTISPAAEEKASEIENERNARIVFLDGEAIAALLVEQGVSAN